MEYLHAIQKIKEALVLEPSKLSGFTSNLEFHFADVICSVMSPSKDSVNCGGHLGSVGIFTANDSFGNTMGTRYSIGGLVWNLPERQRMEDYLLVWIGSDNSAFANVVMTFNGCDIGRSLFL